MSYDRSKAILYRYLSGVDCYYIDLETKSIISLSNYFYDKKRNKFAWLPSTGYNSHYFLGYPYDSEKFFGPLYSGDYRESNEGVKDYVFWAIFETVMGSYDELNFDGSLVQELTKFIE